MDGEELLFDKIALEEFIAVPIGPPEKCMLR